MTPQSTSPSPGSKASWWGSHSCSRRRFERRGAAIDSSAPEGAASAAASTPPHSRRSKARVEAIGVGRSRRDALGKGGGSMRSVARLLQRRRGTTSGGGGSDAGGWRFRRPRRGVYKVLFSHSPILPICHAPCFLCVSGIFVRAVCLGALGLHLGARLEALLGRALPTASHTAARPTAEDGCESLFDSETLLLPEFPSLDGLKFSVPPVPRLLPPLEELQASLGGGFIAQQTHPAAEASTGWVAWSSGIGVGAAAAGVLLLAGRKLSA